VISGRNRDSGGPAQGLANLDDVVHGLAGDDVVEWDEARGQLAQHEHQLLLGVRDHAEAELVVDVGGDRLLLGQELGDQAVGVLTAPLELDDGAADGLDLLDGPQRLLLDEVEDLVVGDGELGQELAAGEVVHDVHDLQDDAGVGAAPPLLRGDEQEIARRHAVCDLVGDLQAEVALEVLDGRLAQLAEPAHVVLVLRLELVDPEEAVDLLAIREVEAVPVDDRSAAEQIPDRGQVAEREVLIADGPHRGAESRSRGRAPLAQSAGVRRRPGRRRGRTRTERNRGQEQRAGERRHDQ